MNTTIYKYSSKIRNIIYHIKTADWEKITRYNIQLNGTRILPFFELLKASWNHGANFTDYYEYSFFKMTVEERRRWITTSLRYEFTRQLNSPRDRQIFRDKLVFAQLFKSLLGRNVWDWQTLTKMKTKTDKPPALVLKPRFGFGGKGIIFTEKQNKWISSIKLIDKLGINPEEYIFESRIENQHTVLSILNPTSLNTLRVITYLNNDKFEFWGTFLKMGTGLKQIDNFGNDGIACWVNSRGILAAPAVSRNPFEKDYITHPVSKKKIVGLKIPFWKDVGNLVAKAHRKVPNTKTVGWDVAIKTDGPCLIEGNSSWGTYILQLPLKKGMRHFVENYTNLRIVYD